MNIFKGFTLFELLITLLIISVLSTIAIPSLFSLTNTHRSDNIYEQLFTLIQFTRSTATFTGNDTILCPTENTEDCINDWQLPVMIFVDSNNNRIRDDSETIERISSLIDQGVTLTWRASGTSRYLRYINDGSTGAQNGSFRICSADKTLSYTRKIIIYRSGRARRANLSEISEEDCG